MLWVVLSDTGKHFYRFQPVRENDINISIEQLRQVAVGCKSGHSRAVTLMVICSPIGAQRAQILFSQQTFD